MMCNVEGTKPKTICTVSCSLENSFQLIHNSQLQVLGITLYLQSIWLQVIFISLNSATFQSKIKNNVTIC